eukprot:TRINITY_DN10593_c0_g1_i1.p1 TRINITY_DN10593_c0_g1~~TRINITY_DN10593_c0_g1_i1.p1  ORF type:complete len:456 (+),score=103.03 TRINITY_DN10593_c0_g1_i1:88-1368(+)
MAQPATAGYVVLRHLARLARQLDEAPMGKALLAAQPLRVFDHRCRKVVSLPVPATADGDGVPPAERELDNLLHAFNDGEHYRPADCGTTSARAALRDAHRRGTGLATGFAALRRLGFAVRAAAKLLEQGAEAQTQSQHEGELMPQLRLLPRGATTASGQLLLTHPVACLGQPALCHAVILLVVHSEDSGTEGHPGFVRGLILNKPLAPALRGMLRTAACSDALGDLADLPLYHGGDVDSRSVSAVYEGTAAGPAEGVSCGLSLTQDLRWLAAQVRAGKVPLDRVKLFAGHAGWLPAQLDVELARNTWFLTTPALEGGLAQAVLCGRGAGAAQLHHGELWAAAVRGLGGEYAELAKAPSDHRVLWSSMEEAWLQHYAELRKRYTAASELAGPFSGKHSKKAMVPGSDSDSAAAAAPAEAPRKGGPPP